MLAGYLGSPEGCGPVMLLPIYFPCHPLVLWLPKHYGQTWFFQEGGLVTDGHTERQTDGQTDGRMDVRTEGRTYIRIKLFSKVST